MKKLKNWAIVTMIFCVLFLALATVCVIGPKGFGEWLVLTYEDLTCELGGTTEQALNKLLMVSFCATAVLFVTNQILLWVYIKKLNNATEEASEITTETVKAAVKEVVAEENKKKKRKQKVKEFVEEVVAEAAPKTAQRTAISKDQEMKNFLDSLRK